MKRTCRKCGTNWDGNYVFGVLPTAFCKACEKKLKTLSIKITTRATQLRPETISRTRLLPAPTFTIIVGKQT